MAVTVRVATSDDYPAIASLRAEWSAAHDADLERRMAAWLFAEGERRTMWLAALDGAPAGMASVFEYRRMPRAGRPDSRWGYVSNTFVRPGLRNRGIGSTLLVAILAHADERGYARLVLSPSARAVSFYRRAFVVPDESAGDHRLLVRPAP